MTDSMLVQALEWALAEINGETTYKFEGQRQAALDVAEEVLADAKTTTAAETGPVGILRQQNEPSPATPDDGQKEGGK